MQFTISTITYKFPANGQYVFRNERTIGYMFINTGNCILTLNQIKLNPGAVLKTLETGMIDMTRYQILLDVFNTCSGTNAELTTLIYERI
jgi:hypothetical protein